MPWSDDRPRLGLPASIRPPEEVEGAGVLGTLAAAFRTENTIASAVVGMQDRTAEGDFDPFATGHDLVGRYPDAFVGLDTRAEFDTRVGMIERELKDRQTLEAAGLWALPATFLAGLIDPINLVPVGGAAYRAGRLGETFLRSTGRAMGAGAVSMTASEALLLGSQDTRTPEEAALNIGVGALVAGLLGGAASTLVAKRGRGAVDDLARGWEQETDQLARAYDDVLDAAEGRELSPRRAGSPDRDVAVPDGDTGRAPFAQHPDGQHGGDSTAGSASTVRTTLQDQTPKGAFGLEKLLRFQDPLLRGMQSVSVETRRAIEWLAELPLTLRKHAAGEASDIPVETLIKMHQAKLYRGLKAVDDAFVRYRTGHGKTFASTQRIGAADVMGAARRTGALTRAQFNEAVGMAMRREDLANTLPIPDAAKPHVTAAAQQMRREVFDPLKQDAIDAGLLPEDVSVETAASYLTRVYNVGKIIAQRGEFKQRITGWLRRQRDNAEHDLDEMRQSLEIAERDLARLQEREATIAESVPKLKEDTRAARQRRQELVGQRIATRHAVKLAERNLRVLERRRALFERTGHERTSDEMRKVFRQVRTGRGWPKPPQRLSAWLRSRGGLKDDGGELRTIGVSGRLLNNKSGMPLDDAAHAAWQEGFVGKPEALGGERPDIDEFLEALRNDVSDTQPIYRDGDDAVLEDIAYLKNVEQLFDELGLDVKKMTDDEALFALSEATGEAAAKPGRVSPERVRELEVALTRAQKAVETERARQADIEKAFEETRQKVRDLDADARLTAGNRDKAQRDLARLKRRVEKLEAKVTDTKAFGRADDLELDDIAEQIIDTLIGSPAGRIPYDAVPLARGPLRERTFNIPDQDIEDFLESDIEHVGRIYTRTMAPDVELTRRFGRADMQDMRAKIIDDYNRKIAAAASERERKRLEAAKQADLRDVDAVRDRLRHTYAMPAHPEGLPHRIAAGVRSLNYLRLMGGVTLSSIPDVARSVMVHGLTRTIGDGLVPLVRSFRAARLAGEEAKLAGSALDMVLDSRAMAIADIMDDFGRHSKFERGIQAATRHFGVVSLMAPWNAALKQFAGMVTQTRMLRAVTTHARGGKTRRSEIERLARLGIDEHMAVRIAGQFDRYGAKEGGVWWANTSAWDDAGAVRHYRAALVREVDEIIVTPGQDKPLWMSTDLGKTIGQFKSFAVASVQRSLLSGLQRRDMAFLNGAALSVGLGMFTAWAKMETAGFDTSDWDMDKWVVEGLDRSGLGGWFLDANNIMEKATRGTVGISRLTGEGQMSRYASRNVLGAVLGPSADAFSDTVTAVGSAFAGDWHASDTHGVRKMLPAQNIFYARWLLDHAERGINRTLGVEERRR